MRRVFRIALILLGLPLAVFVLAVNLVTPGMPEPAPFDPTLPLELEDGRVTTLGAVLAQEKAVGPARTSRRPSAREPRTRLRPWRDDSMIRVGFQQLGRGHPEKALAVWRAIPRDHHDYARAQRYIGYWLYDRTLDTPWRGVAHVNRSLIADPLSGNAWQDAARIYWHTAQSAWR
ncbi:MAG: hypothetical protein QNJ98_19550 [Planctomycetota bacterium]|nr:hypothetical protein [Planctomycetota bacterium]